MFTTTKYIVVSNADGHTEKMIIFPSSIKHETMFGMFKESLWPKIVSAGFISEFMECYGESMSVNRKSRDLDTLMLQIMLSIDDKEIKMKKNQGDAPACGL